MLSFPLIWMVIGTVSVFLPNVILARVGAEMGATGAIVTALLGAAVGLVFYQLTMRYVAVRPTPELAPRRFAREMLLGLAVGSAFIGAAVLVVAAAGVYRVVWAPRDALATVVFALAVSAGAAIVEELTFRGVIFQAVEQLGGPRIGRWIALVVTALLFGGVHLLNSGATPWSSVAVAIEAGILLGAAFMWRGNLWFVIGIHFAWNVIEGLLGIPISGHHIAGLFLTTVHGPDVLTGGDFGLEASVVPVVVSLALAIPMLIAGERRRARQGGQHQFPEASDDFS
ncbi:CPBP family intramembrane glutamic endopeptidase [Mycolicibacterium komossense]|uniref:CPBP family intramembrane metalloprotease n=1 Tax=Mycolicibacterium komossense TaxID=1779 RepID=A0ABT3CKS3_9MYCO|nr:type II CAAX endopeptidase family protein [Mycolicibacterium komossense]MCV7230138.1 CPBP family intramembrane metalloprotease [Mycolicibacterium komossense]